MSNRLVLLLIVCGAGIAGFLLGGAGSASHTIASADPSFIRLMRGMTMLKMTMAACATAAVLWRLRSPAPLRWFAAYGLACAVMWTGPGLIWDMAYIRTGALALHGGLLAALVLIWRDPAVANRLAGIIASRRASLRGE